MHVDHTQTGTLSALSAKKTAGGFERKQAAQAIDRPSTTAAAKRPSIMPLPDSKAAPEAPPSFPPSTPWSGTPENLSVDELLKAWGQQDAKYDLNSDGIVDMKDLMQLLSDLAKDETPSEDDLISHPPSELRLAGLEPSRSDLGDPAAEPTAPPSSEVAATRTDLAGTVAATFSALAPPRGAGDSDPADPRRSEARVDRPTTADAETRRADQVARNLSEAKARFLLDQLERSGFDQSPPQNLHEILDSLGLGPTERESLLDRLETRYPRGLGLNTLA